MPTVPKSELPTQSLPGGSGFRVSGTGAGAVGAAGQRLGSTIATVGGQQANNIFRMQERENHRIAEDNATGLLLFKNDRLSNPESGYLNRLGHNAVGSTETLQKELDEEASRIRKGLNSRQRELFDEQVLPILIDGINQSSIHEAKQLRVAESETAAMAITARHDDMVQNFASPDDSFAINLDAYESRIHEDSMRTNGDKQTADLAAEIAVEDVIAKRAQTALNTGDIASAERVLRTHGDRLDTLARKALETQVNDGYGMLAAQHAANVAVHILGAETKRQARAEARDYAVKEMATLGRKPSRAVLKELEKLVDDTFDFRQKDQEIVLDRADNRAIEGMRAVIEQQTLTGSDPQAVLRHHATERIKLLDRPSALKTFDTMYENWRENPGLGGFAVINDPVTLANARYMTDKELTQLSDNTLNELRSRLTQSTFETEIMAKRQSALNKQGQTPGEKARALTESEINSRVAIEANRAGLVTGTTPSQISPQEASVITALQDQMLAEMGEDLSPESFRRAAGQVFFEVFAREDGWNLGIFESEGTPRTQAQIIQNPHLLKRSNGELWQKLEAEYTPERMADPFFAQRVVRDLFAAEARRRRDRELSETLP